MTAETPSKATSSQHPEPGPQLHVAPGPHLSSRSSTTRRMMLEVILGLVPVIGMAIFVFRWHAVLQISLCIVACLAAESLFARWRARNVPISDLSAVVTGLILGLSLPWSAPWYVGVVASVVAIGVGKSVFGGLGQNLFNPAMVGRAFVMMSFASVMGAPAYVRPDATLEILTQATPLTAGKQAAAELPGLWWMFVGQTNGSLGETSALACLVGGLYLCWRRSASWEIPMGVLLGAVLVAGFANVVNPGTPLTVLHHLLGGSLIFGAFFIATDPVTSPLTNRGKWIFGFGIGILIVTLRIFSNYPEGVVFAILLMNSMVPLIDRWMVPQPFGGAVTRGAVRPAGRGS